MTKLFKDFQNQMNQQGFDLVLEKKVQNFKFDDAQKESYCLYYHKTKHILIVADTYSYGTSDYDNEPVLNGATAYMAYAFNDIYSNSDYNDEILRLLPSNASVSYTRGDRAQWTQLICVSLREEGFNFNHPAWNRGGKFINWKGVDFSHSIFLRPEFYTDKDTHHNLDAAGKIQIHGEDSPNYEERKREARINLSNKNFIKKTLHKAMLDWEDFYKVLPLDVQQKFNLMPFNSNSHSHHDINNALIKAERLYPYTAQAIHQKTAHFSSQKSRGIDKRQLNFQKHLDDYCSRNVWTKDEGFSDEDKNVWQNINHNLKIIKEAALLNLNPQRLKIFLDKRLKLNEKGELFQELEHKEFKFINLFIAIGFLSPQKNICNYLLKKAVEENKNNNFFNRLLEQRVYKEHTTALDVEMAQGDLSMTMLEDMCFGPKTAFFGHQTFSLFLAHNFKKELCDYFLKGGSFQATKIINNYDNSRGERTSHYLKAILMFDKYNIPWWGSLNSLDKIEAYRRIVDVCRRHQKESSKLILGPLGQIEMNITLEEKKHLLKEIALKKESAKGASIAAKFKV